MAGWIYHGVSAFLAPTKLVARGRLARRRELALPVVVQERLPPNLWPEVGWRAEASWPYWRVEA